MIRSAVAEGSSSWSLGEYAVSIRPGLRSTASLPPHQSRQIRRGQTLLTHLHTHEGEVVCPYRGSQTPVQGRSTPRTGEVADPGRGQRRSPQGRAAAAPASEKERLFKVFCGSALVKTPMVRVLARGLAAASQFALCAHPTRRLRRGRISAPQLRATQRLCICR